jgi:hypothetical protein
MEMSFDFISMLQSVQPWNLSGSQRFFPSPDSTHVKASGTGSTLFFTMLTPLDFSVGGVALIAD